MGRYRERDRQTDRQTETEREKTGEKQSEIGILIDSIWSLEKYLD